MPDWGPHRAGEGSVLLCVSGSPCIWGHHSHHCPSVGTALPRKGMGTTLQRQGGGVATCVSTRQLMEGGAGVGRNWCCGNSGSPQPSVHSCSQCSAETQVVFLPHSCTCTQARTHKHRFVQAPLGGATANFAGACPLGGVFYCFKSIRRAFLGCSPIVCQFRISAQIRGQGTGI